MHMVQPAVLLLFPVLISMRKELNQSHMVMTKRMKSLPTGQMGVGSGNTLDPIYIWPIASDLASLSLLCAGVLEGEQMCLMESEVAPDRVVYISSTVKHYRGEVLGYVERVTFMCSFQYILFKW